MSISLDLMMQLGDQNVLDRVTIHHNKSSTKFSEKVNDPKDEVKEMTKKTNAF